MGVWDFVKSELIDIIQWLDETALTASMPIDPLFDEPQPLNGFDLPDEQAAAGRRA